MDCPIVGSGDRLTTLILQNYDAAINPAITLFEDIDCTVRSAVFQLPTHEEEAEFLLSDVLRRGVGNDRVTSFRIEKGLSAIFYAEDGWMGDKLVIDTGDAFFKSQPNLNCFNLFRYPAMDLTFNDRLSSLKLFRRSEKPALGSWHPLGSTLGKFEMEVKTGVAKSQSRDSTLTLGSKLTFELAGGV